MNRNQAKEEIKKIIFKYLSPSDYQVFIFGSRAVGSNAKWSDYDIGVLGKEKVPLSILAKIDDDLEESNIPYLVDVVDFNNVSDKFKEVASGKIILWSKPKH